jgi:hypothetical protein
MAKLLSTEEFVATAKAIYGDRYLYNKVNIVDSKTKIEIQCPAHGPFFILPKKHIDGRRTGCPRCRYMSHLTKIDLSAIKEIPKLSREGKLRNCRKVTNEEYIQRAKLKHGTKFDYSRTEYKNTVTKVEIGCPLHGYFFIRPQAHVNSAYGCPTCGNPHKSMKGTKRIRHTLDSFIEAIKKVHGEVYDYGLITHWPGNKVKLPIKCKTHGVFYVTGNQLLSKATGCKICNIAKRTKAQLAWTLEGILDNFKNIHGDKYDFREITEYRGLSYPVTVTCKKHNYRFKMAVRSLLKGHGCTLCARASRKCIRISKQEILCLNYLKIPDEDRQIMLTKDLTVDSLNKQNNTVVEYLGDYFHGNPRCYTMTSINKIAQKTFQELYDRTFARFQKIKEMGYAVKYIWESDWLAFKKGKVAELVIHDY